MKNWFKIALPVVIAGIMLVAVGSSNVSAGHPDPPDGITGCLSEAGVSGISGKTQNKEDNGIHTIEICVPTEGELDLIFTMTWNLKSKKDLAMRITDPNGVVTLRDQTRAHIEVAQFNGSPLPEPANGIWTVEIFNEGKGVSSYGLSVVLV